MVGRFRRLGKLFFWRVVFLVPLNSFEYRPMTIISDSLIGASNQLHRTRGDLS